MADEYWHMHDHCKDEGYSEIDNESTLSLDSSFIDQSLANDQSYQACQHRDKKNNWPNDKCELERLELMHLLSKLASDGYLYWAPIDWSPQRILDIGCGTGTWCIEMADLYPSAEVIGVDLSPFQPILVPPNVSFQLDDVEEEWTWTRPFDYIHVRYMDRTIRNWPEFMHQCFQHCISGGWVEFQDVESAYTAHEAHLSKESRILQWLSYSCDEKGPCEKNARICLLLFRWMQEVGFINVQYGSRNSCAQSSIKLYTVYGQKP